MKKALYSLAFIILATGCSGDREGLANAEKPSEPETEVTSQEMIDPDTTDNVPAGQYTSTTADPQMAANIRNALRQDLLKDDLASIPEEHRRFSYDQVDLNNDGRNEYLIGFRNPYFCGSGGCTFMLLDHEGSLVTRFSVSRSPFVVLPETSNGWHHLVVESDGKRRLLEFNGKSYPPNPSVTPVFEQIPGDNLRRLLDYNAPIPTFEF